MMHDGRFLFNELGVPFYLYFYVVIMIPNIKFDLFSPPSPNLNLLFFDSLFLTLISYKVMGMRGVIRRRGIWSSLCLSTYEVCNFSSCN